LNECYILARSFLERLINYTYLLSCDEEEYSRYLAYTKQKAYRVLDRSFTAGDSKVELTWSGSIDLEKEPELKKAVDMFTSETGKEGRILLRFCTLAGTKLAPKPKAIFRPNGVDVKGRLTLILRHHLQNKQAIL